MCGPATVVTYICQLEFLSVVDTGHSDLALGHVIVVVNVIREEAHLYIYRRREGIFCLV